MSTKAHRRKRGKAPVRKLKDKKNESRDDILWKKFDEYRKCVWTSESNEWHGRIKVIHPTKSLEEWMLLATVSQKCATMICFGNLLTKKLTIKELKEARHNSRMKLYDLQTLKIKNKKSKNKLKSIAYTRGTMASYLSVTQQSVNRKLVQFKQEWAKKNAFTDTPNTPDWVSNLDKYTFDVNRLDYEPLKDHIADLIKICENIHGKTKHKAKGISGSKWSKITKNKWSQYLPKNYPDASSKSQWIPSDLTKLIFLCDQEQDATRSGKERAKKLWSQVRFDCDEEGEFMYCEEAPNTKNGVNADARYENKLYQRKDKLGLYHFLKIYADLRPREDDLGVYCSGDELNDSFMLRPLKRLKRRDDGTLLGFYNQILGAGGIEALWQEIGLIDFGFKELCSVYSLRNTLAVYYINHGMKLHTVARHVTKHREIASLGRYSEIMAKEEEKEDTFNAELKQIIDKNVASGYAGRNDHEEIDAVIERLCAECDEAKNHGEYSKGNVWYCSECWFVWDETQKNHNNNNTNTNTGNVTQNMNTNTGNVAPSALPPLNLQKFWL
eukprot:180520_1